MEQMTEAERKYWEQKRRLLLSEAAEIERMLNADQSSKPARPCKAAGQDDAGIPSLPSLGVHGAGIGR